jgi:hypothetical protein
MAAAISRRVIEGTRRRPSFPAGADLPGRIASEDLPPGLRHDSQTPLEFSVLPPVGRREPGRGSDGC